MTQSTSKDFIERLAPFFTRATRSELSEQEMGELNALFDSQVHLDSTLGTRYVAMGPQGVSAELTVTSGHVQPWNVANGGVYCSLGESTASLAGYIAAGASKPVVGVNNTTDFLRSCSPGQTILSSAAPVFLGRTQQVWEIRHTLKDEGTLLAVTKLRTAVLDR